MRSHILAQICSQMDYYLYLKHLDPDLVGSALGAANKLSGVVIITL